MTFEQELRELINMYSLENESSTPDFVLASFVLASIDAFDSATKERDQHYKITFKTTIETSTLNKNSEPATTGE